MAATNLKKKGEQTPLPLSITDPRNYGRSHCNLVPRVLSYPLYGAREGERGREREREREREPGNEVEAAAEDVPFFHSSLLTRELIKPISRR